MLKNSIEKEKKLIAQELWLSFFNEYLFKADAITQEERIKMNEIILRVISKQRKKGQVRLCKQGY